MIPVAARCAQHPDTSAVDVCQRCGAFVCGTCVNIREEDVFCPSCLPFLASTRSNRKVRAAVMLGFATPAFLLLSMFLRRFGIWLLAAGLLCFLGALLIMIIERSRRAKAPDNRARGYHLAWMALWMDAALIAGLLGLWSQYGH